MAELQEIDTKITSSQHGADEQGAAPADRPEAFARHGAPLPRPTPGREGPRCSPLRLLVLVLALTGCAQAGPVVWCVGDSITALYATQLAALEPTWTVVNAGVGSETSDTGARRLFGLLLTVRPLPDAIVLAWAANDVLQQIVADNRVFTAAYTVANLRTAQMLAEAIRVPGIVALPVGTVPTDPLFGDGGNAFVRAYGDALLDIRDGAAALRPIVDHSLDQTALFGVPQLGLGVHPDATGTLVLARRTDAAVRRALGMELRP